MLLVIPQAFVPAESHDHSSAAGASPSERPVFKACVVMFAIYGFFLLECIMKVRAAKKNAPARLRAHACGNVKLIKVRGALSWRAFAQSPFRPSRFPVIPEVFGRFRKHNTWARLPVSRAGVVTGVNDGKSAFSVSQRGVSRSWRWRNSVNDGVSRRDLTPCCVFQICRLVKS